MVLCMHAMCLHWPLRQWHARTPMAQQGVQNLVRLSQLLEEFDGVRAGDAMQFGGRVARPSACLGHLGTALA